MGHQFNQHYLDSMFPLKPVSSSSTPLLPSPSSPFHNPEENRGGIGNSGFLGADEEGNDFMSSTIELGAASDEKRDERESCEMSYLGTHGVPLDNGEEEVLLRDMSPVSTFGSGSGSGLTAALGMRNGIGKGNKGFTVGDLSRLWLYRNGKSPKTDDVDIGIARMSTV